MFVLSVKMSTVKLVTIIAVLGLIVAVAAWPRADVAPTVRNTDSADPSSRSTINYQNIKTNEDRIAFLKQFGWEVELEPVECQEIIIPAVFNNVYKQYNAIQKKQGLDLTPYRSKRVKRYTYRIKNFPDQTSEVRTNVIIYNDKVIGGDVYQTKLDGFMTGFNGDLSTRSANADITDPV